jgi:hypothetical protein
MAQAFNSQKNGNANKRDKLSPSIRLKASTASTKQFIDDRRIFSRIFKLE